MCSFECEERSGLHQLLNQHLLVTSPWCCVIHSHTGGDGPSGWSHYLLHNIWHHMWNLRSALWRILLHSCYCWGTCVQQFPERRDRHKDKYTIIYGARVLWPPTVEKPVICCISVSLSLSSMYSTRPPSQSELQHQCGNHDLGIYHEWSALQSDSSSCWWTWARVPSLPEHLWADGPALWRALHGHSKSRGPKLQQPSKWKCYHQDGYELAHHIINT